MISVDISNFLVLFGRKNSKDVDSIFSLDEDSKTTDFTEQPVEHFTNDFEEDDDSDDKKEEIVEYSDDFFTTANTDDNLPFTESPRTRTRHTGGTRRDVPQASSTARLPSAAIAASLPVTISRGFWPPAEAPDSLREDDFEDDVTFNNMDRHRAKTILPQRDGELYQQFQAYSRSIQPADDPERLFGERPRRRYRTGNKPEEETLSEIPSGSVVGIFCAPSFLQSRGNYVAQDLNNLTSNNEESKDSSENNTPLPRIIVPSSLTYPY